MFHHRDGWYFVRRDDGSVKIVVTETTHADAPPLLTHTITPNEWASIIAAVCARGENSESYRDALDFHTAIPTSGGQDAPGGPDGVIVGRRR